MTGGSEGPTKYDYATIRYDLLGAPVWVVRYDNAPVGKFDVAYDLVFGENGEILVAGASESATKYDFATVKYLVDGTQVWVNRRDGGIGKKDIARALAYDDEEEKVYVTGSSEQGAGRKWDYLTQRIDGLTGVTEWVGRYNGPGQKNDFAFNVAIRPGGGSLVVTGSSIGLGSKADYATIQGPVDTALPGPIVPGGIPDEDEEEGEEEEDWEEILDGEEGPARVLLAQNYPNPFKPQTTLAYWLPSFSRVRLQVFDVLGRLVVSLVEEEQDEGLQEIEWEPVGLASGLYFYRLEVSPVDGPTGASANVGKMLLVR